MAAFLRSHDTACVWLILLLLRAALAVDEHRRRSPRACRRLRGSLRRLVDQWMRRHGLAAPARHPRRPRRPWNRTPAAVEERVVRLHVEQPLLGAGQLRWLAERVLGFRAARETFRRILIRRRDLVVAIEQERRRRLPWFRFG